MPKVDPARYPVTPVEPRSRPGKTVGSTSRVDTDCGHLYVTVNFDDQGVCEVFAHLGKSGGCAAAQLEATCRLASLVLRSGVDVSSVVKHLRGIRCPSAGLHNGDQVLSCSDCVAKVLAGVIGSSGMVV